MFHNPVLDEEDRQLLYERFRNTSLLNESPDSYFDRIITLAPAESENYQKIDGILAGLGSSFFERRGHILDVGCGGGVFIHTFNSIYPNWRAYGIV